MTAGSLSAILLVSSGRLRAFSSRNHRRRVASQGGQVKEGPRNEKSIKSPLPKGGKAICLNLHLNERSPPLWEARDSMNGESVTFLIGPIWAMKIVV